MTQKMGTTAVDVDALPVVLRRLLPSPEASPRSSVGRSRVGRSAPDHRPYVVLNMVATADGAAAVAHRSAPMSNPADRQLFQELRAHVDAVMVGAGTVRIERYGRLVRDPRAVSAGYPRAGARRPGHRREPPVDPDCGRATAGRPAFSRGRAHRQRRRTRGVPARSATCARHRARRWTSP